GDTLAAPPLELGDLALDLQDPRMHRLEDTIEISQLPPSDHLQFLGGLDVGIQALDPLVDLDDTLFQLIPTVRQRFAAGEEESTLDFDRLACLSCLGRRKCGLIELVALGAQPS